MTDIILLNNTNIKVFGHYDLIIDGVRKIIVNWINFKNNMIGVSPVNDKMSGLVLNFNDIKLNDYNSFDEIRDKLNIKKKFKFIVKKKHNLIIKKKFKLKIKE